MVFHAIEQPPASRPCSSRQARLKELAAHEPLGSFRGPTPRSPPAPPGPQGLWGISALAARLRKSNKDPSRAPTLKALEQFEHLGVTGPEIECCLELSARSVVVPEHGQSTG